MAQVPKKHGPALNFAFPPSMSADWHIAREKWFAQNPEFRRLVVAAFVFHDPPSTVQDPNPSPRMLIIQRSHEEPWAPDVWETPGGGCEEEDVTVLHAAARELWEEAGLAATAVVGEPVLQEWTEERPHKIKRDEKGEIVEVRWRKVVFEMEVAGGKEGEKTPAVRLDPVEHQDFLWATEEEVRAGKIQGREVEFMYEATRDVILRGFEKRRARLAKEVNGHSL